MNILVKFCILTKAISVPERANQRDMLKQKKTLDSKMTHISDIDKHNMK